MKVTPLNIARFWKRLMFPPIHPEYHGLRLALKGDLPWEPWMHCAVWVSMFMVLIHGDRGVAPPDELIEWSWIIGGLIFPPLGFSSVWVLAHKTGRLRYIAIWVRTVADVGLALSLFLYQLSRLEVQGFEPLGWGEDGLVPNVVMNFSIWFLMVLGIRDVKLLIATEKLASKIRAGDL
jgi:hypothetical protein